MRVSEKRKWLLTSSRQLRVTSDNLSKSKVAQKQQHKLVVSWRISVDDMTDKMEQQSKAMQDLRAGGRGQD